MSNVTISVEVGECNCVEKVRADSARRGREIDGILGRAVRALKEGGKWDIDKGRRESKSPSKSQEILPQQR